MFCVRKKGQRKNEILTEVNDLVNYEAIKAVKKYNRRQKEKRRKTRSVRREVGRRRIEKKTGKGIGKQLKEKTDKGFKELSLIGKKIAGTKTTKATGKWSKKAFSRNRMRSVPKVERIGREEDLRKVASLKMKRYFFSKR